jgi:hypothetical protein
MFRRFNSWLAEPAQLTHFDKLILFLTYMLVCIRP